MNRYAISGAALPAVLSLPMSDGDAGVTQTVRCMRQLIDQGKKDPAVHERAAWILHAYHVRAFDFDGEFRAIFAWIKQNIRWTRDPTGKEGLHSAPEILRLRIGDCDDFSILMCSMLGTIGHRTRLVTISNHPDEPETFSHIYPEVQLESGKWIPMDGGRKHPAFGKGPSRYFRRHVWDVDQDEDFEDAGGMGALNMTRRPRSRRMMGWSTPTFRPTAQGRVAQRTFMGFDWSTLVNDLPAITNAATTGAANIIRAGDQPGIAAAQYNAAVLNSQYAAANPLSAISPTTLLLLGGAVLAVMLISRKGQ